MTNIGSEAEPKVENVNLPFFGESEVLYIPPVVGREGVEYQEKLRTIQENTSERFVREVRLGPGIGIATLTEYLDLADEIFDYTATAIGAKVIGHTWGLAPPNPYIHRPHPLVPPSATVVAEVDILRNVRDLTESEARNARVSMTDFANLRRSIGQPWWRDYDAKQFINGQLTVEGREELWLVDIEPFLTTSETLHLPLISD